MSGGPSETHSDPEDRPPATAAGTFWVFRPRMPFWLASSAIFAVNAVLSLLADEWVLATLQFMTAALAILAAVEAAQRRPPRGPAPVRSEPRGRRAAPSARTRK